MLLSYWLSVHFGILSADVVVWHFGHHFHSVPFLISLGTSWSIGDFGWVVYLGVDVLGGLAIIKLITCIVITLILN